MYKSLWMVLYCTCSFFTFFFGTGSTLFSDSVRLRTDLRCCFLSKGSVCQHNTHTLNTHRHKSQWHIIIILLTKSTLFCKAKQSCPMSWYDSSVWSHLRIALSAMHARHSPGHSSLRETRPVLLRWNMSPLRLYRWSPETRRKTLSNHLSQLKFICFWWTSQENKWKVPQVSEPDRKASLHSPPS